MRLARRPAGAPTPPPVERLHQACLSALDQALRKFHQQAVRGQMPPRSARAGFGTHFSSWARQALRKALEAS